MAAGERSADLGQEFPDGRSPPGRDCDETAGDKRVRITLAGHLDVTSQQPQLLDNGVTLFIFSPMTREIGKRPIENRDRRAESDREVKKTNGLGYK